jgi:hypothetical protein
MKLRKALFVASAVLGISVVTTGSVIAQGMMGGTGQGMMGGGVMQGESNRGMGMHGGGRGMMGHSVMHGGESGMMCPMMRSMMQGHHEMMSAEMMRGSTGGMGVLFGSRVVPTMNLSVDDVRGYLTAKLDRLGNRRLKIGDIKADGGSITAEIVTADNSLVQRMKVDRSTGNIEYEN